MVYRNIYVLKYKRMPLHMFKGTETLLYYNNIEYVKSVPNAYNNKIDLVIDCDCQFSKWRKIEKVFK